MANEAEIIASNLLSSAIEYKRLYDTTKKIEYREKEQRLRRIAENVKLLASSSSASTVNSFNGRTGAVTLTSADVTGALGYVPPTTLDGLTDVTISAPANAQVLTYNSTTSQWENQTPASSGGTGDMSKSTYDVDNDGVVDSAERTEIIVRNSTGVTLTKGQVVYLSGATGNRPNALLSKADTEATSSKTIGIVVADIANNSDGYVATNGTLHDLDTSAFADGAALWLSATTAGGMTSTIPAEPNHTVFIGYVARSHPTQGRLVILIQNGYELNELHGVLVTSEANNDLLTYESSTGLWKNKTFSAIFGGTPLVSVPTLDQVTTAGNTTTNAITVGNTTINGTYFQNAGSPIPIIVKTSNNEVAQYFSTAQYAGFRVVARNVDGVPYIGLNTSSTISSNGVGTQKAFFAYWGDTANYSSLGYGNNTNVIAFNNATGNVVISTGTTFTDAGYKLDVNGTARVSGTSTIAMTSPSSWAFYINFNTNIGHAFTPTNAKLYRLSITGNYQSGAVGDLNPMLNVAGSVTASAALAQGVYFNNTLVAAANNDVLVGLDIAPTFTNGAFTGVTNWALRVTGDAQVTYRLRVDGIGVYTQNIRSIVASDTSIALNGITDMQLTTHNSATNGFRFSNVGTGELMRLYRSGNLVLQTGGTFTDAGFKLDVNGTGRFTSTLTANSFVKSGGTSSQFLKADGSVDSSTYLTAYTETDTLNTVTTRGNTTSNNIVVTAKMAIGASASIIAPSLYVYGAKGAFGTFSDTVAGFKATGNTYISVDSDSGNDTGVQYISNGVTNWVVYNSRTLTGFAFYSTSTSSTVALLKDNGNLLVGTTTDSGYKLQVSGTTRSDKFLVIDTANTSVFRIGASTSSEGGLYLRSGAASDGEIAGGVYFTSGFAYAAATGASAINFYNGHTYFTGNSGLTVGATFTPTTRMFIQNNGDIGIGNTSPSAKLHVSGTIKATLANVTTSNVVYYDSSTGLMTYGAAPSGGSGTVTSVGLSSTTSGVTIGATPITTSGTITIDIATATPAQNGLLSSTDWNTFNGKQSTITLTTTGTSGAATLIGNVLNIPNYATGSSQWTTSGSNIYYTTGNVLIGTATASGQKLQVLGTTFMKGTATGNTTPIFEVQNQAGASIMDFRNDYAFFGCGQGGGSSTGFLFRMNNTSYVQFAGYNYGGGSGAYKPILMDTDIGGRGQGIFVNFGTSTLLPPNSDTEFAVRGRTADATSFITRFRESGNTDRFAVRCDGALFTNTLQGYSGSVAVTTPTGTKTFTITNGLITNVV